MTTMPSASIADYVRAMSGIAPKVAAPDRSALAWDERDALRISAALKANAEALRINLDRAWDFTAAGSAVPTPEFIAAHQGEGDLTARIALDALREEIRTQMKKGMIEMMEANVRITEACERLNGAMETWDGASRDPR